MEKGTNSKRFVVLLIAVWMISLLCSMLYKFEMIDFIYFIAVGVALVRVAVAREG